MMVNTINVNELLPGDVTLYKGTGFISRAIQFFDGTDFSHAAVYLGDGMVGEAIASGLERQPYEKGAHDIWVQAHRLTEVVPTMDPVLNVANAYLDQGNRYGYEQLLLLAFLCLTRKLRLSPTMRYLVRSVLDSAASTLTTLVSQKKQPMICSEFVYRAYDEALPQPDDIYSLWINRPAAPFAAPAPRGMATPSLVKGQGIHPQSLLAFHNASSSSVWVEPAPTEPTPAPRGQPKDAEDQLEALVEGYLIEVQADPQSKPRGFAPPEPTFAELNASINNFATSLYASTHPEYAQTRARSAPAAEVMVNAYLTQTAADFVTPGDLYKTQSLFLLGKIDI
jgi:hypothetical protein